jgi:hypothetical protein
MGKYTKRYGLQPDRAPKKSREMIDFDYLDKLSDEELDWLDKFSREYYNDAFTHADPLHEKGSEERRKRHRTNNERRRDIWNNLQRAPYDYTDSSVFGDEGEDDE